MTKEENLTLRLKREWLVETSTENLVRLARFLEIPSYEELDEGPRRHKLINAIQRVEKNMELGRPHPYKEKSQIITLKEKSNG